MRLINVLFVLVSITAFSQDRDIDFYKKVEQKALPHINKIVNAEIEHLKNTTPPKNTWTFKRLSAYKDSLNLNPQKIRRGRFIIPSTEQPNLCNVCEVAWTRIEDDYHYYYAVCIGIGNDKGTLKYANKYLFTNKETLRKWWATIFNYFESDLAKTVPKEFLMPFPPPPPFFGNLNESKQ